MKADIPPLEAAAAHYRARRFREAELACAQVLEREPANAEALHWMSLVALEAGRNEEAGELIARALALVPTNPALHFNRGEALRRTGRHEEALASFRSAVELKPDFAEAHFSLGVVLAAQAETAAAIEHYREAVSIRPAFPEAHGELGVALHELGRLHEAERSCREAIALDPQQAETQRNLGVVLYELGRLEEAEPFLRRAVALKPAYAKAWNSLGNVLRALGRLQGAEQAYRQALALRPAFAAAHNNLGVVLKDTGRLEEAEACFRRALELKVDYPSAWLNAGNAARDLGRREDAEQRYRQALALDPASAPAHNSLGVLLKDAGKPAEAEQVLREALSREPGYVDAHLNLGNALKDLGRLEEAAQSYGRALELRGDYAEAHYNLGNVLLAMGRHGEAEQSFRRALELKPEFAGAYSNLGNALLRLGRVESAEHSYRRAMVLDAGFSLAHSNLILAMDFQERYGVAEQQAERRRWYELHGRRYAEAIRPHENVPDPERRLRVGYVSADFFRHSASFAFAPVICRHDRSAFEVFCYSGVAGEDEVTARLRAATDHWQSTLGMSDDALTAQIRRDGIDILVDLSGHSAGNRLLVFARKPAPVQVSAWGHATGTGMATMDYLIADPVSIPPPDRHHYAEELLDLPGAMCYEAPPYLPDVNALPALAGTGFTFGCVNRPEKISDLVIGLWSRVLSELPGASLLVKGRGLDDAAHREQFLARLAYAGIGRERVRLEGRTTHPAHLRIFHEVHVLLDPYPHGGGISTAEALVMGVPVVTLAGETPPSRIAASMLSSLEMRNWVAGSADEYVRIAVRATQDLASLALLRQGLRGRLLRSPLGDVERYTREVERIYRIVWRRWCERSARKDGGASGGAVPRALGPEVRGEALQVALSHHQGGRLAQAEAGYRQVLRDEPGNAAALHGLGLIELGAGRPEAALDLIGRALEVDRDEAVYHNSLGIALKDLGRLHEAEGSYRRALALVTGFAEAHNNLGNVLMDLGRPGEAEQSYRQAMALKREFAMACSNLGNAQRTQGRLVEAEGSFRHALALDPAFAEAHNNLGNVLKDLGRLDEAESSYRSALALRADYAEGHRNLGNLLVDLGRLDEAEQCFRQALLVRADYADAHVCLGNLLRRRRRPEEALRACAQALALEPRSAEAHFGHGNVLAALRRPHEAEQSFRQAIALNPDFAEAHNNLGIVLDGEGRLADAEAHYRRALALKPDFERGWNNLGNVLIDRGRIGEGVDAYRKALALRPDDATIHSNLLFALHYDARLEPRALFAEHRAWNVRHGQPLASRALPHRNSREPQRPLRVGYVSADLRRHPVGHYLEPVLEARDRAMHRAYCYSAAAREDDMTLRLRQLADQWRNVADLGDAELERLIREDGIDLLVDLAGHTGGNRLPVFARRPAPVQATWIGCCDTTGMDAMDYLIADATLAPEGATQPCSERVLRLSASFVCYRAPEYAPQVSSAPALRKGYPTFGCFNNLSKVNDAVLDAWSAILRRQRDARLVLKAKSLNDRRTREEFQEKLVSRGIAPERIELQGSSPHAELLGHYGAVDVALDPFPYTGGISTLEALWMGVPVVTLAGSSCLSRVGASLLRSADLRGLIAESSDTYVEIASALACDRERLAALRGELRSRLAASPLCDAAAFTRGLESAYRAIWIEWCARG